MEFLSPGSRIYLHVPIQTRIGSIIKMIQTQREIVGFITDRVEEPVPATLFQISQLSQKLLESILQSDPILILEASPVLGQFSLPRDSGRVLVIGTDLTPLQALVQSALFMSGSSSIRITPFDLAIFLSQIGKQIPDTTHLIYTVIPVQIPLTPNQYQEYLLRPQELPITNFLYPNLFPRDLRPRLPPDLLQIDGGWITPESIRDLPQLSPKLNWLGEYLRLKPGKHVVYTRFNDTYGVKVIATFLKLLGHSVSTVTTADRQKDRLYKLGSFREVLVTNLHPFTDLPGVDSLVIFEQAGDDVLLNAYLKRLPNGISVVLLLSVGPQGQPTVETQNYFELARRLNARDTLVELLKRGNADLERVRTDLQVPTLTAQDLSLRIPQALPNLK